MCPRPCAPGPHVLYYGVLSAHHALRTALVPCADEPEPKPKQLSLFDSLKARSGVVWTAVALYGMPAFGTLVLTGGKPNAGGVCLGLSVALALYGRGPDRFDARS